jgi:hypothetical protein
MAKAKPRKKSPAAKAAKAATPAKSARPAKLPKRKVAPKAAGKGGRPKLPKNENGVVLLAGGNPQVAKADGDAPVQHYIANMPGWKSTQGRKLDALITRTVPAVRKAVKWNSPFYGIEGQGWFLAFHVFTKYIKVHFFRGRSLEPPPPVPSSEPRARYVHIDEGGFDDAQMTEWIKQAAAIPGWMA